MGVSCLSPKAPAAATRVSARPRVPEVAKSPRQRKSPRAAAFPSASISDVQTNFFRGVHHPTDTVVGLRSVYTEHAPRQAQPVAEPSPREAQPVDRVGRLDVDSPRKKRGVGSSRSRVLPFRSKRSFEPSSGHDEWSRARDEDGGDGEPEESASGAALPADAPLPAGAGPSAEPSPHGQSGTSWSVEEMLTRRLRIFDAHAAAEAAHIEEVERRLAELTDLIESGEITDAEAREAMREIDAATP